MLWSSISTKYGAHVAELLLELLQLPPRANATSAAQKNTGAARSIVPASILKESATHDECAIGANLVLHLTRHHFRPDHRTAHTSAQSPWRRTR